MKVQIICPDCYERIYTHSFFGLFKLPECPTCELLKQMKSNSRNLFLHGYLPGAKTIKHVATIRSEFPDLTIDLNGQMRQACFYIPGYNSLTLEYDELPNAIKLIHQFLNA